MSLFCNPKCIGDVAFSQVEPVKGELNYNKKGDAIEITNEGNVVGYNIFEITNEGNTIGYNIFKISKDITIEETDHTKLVDKLANVLQKRISEAGFDYKLNADLSPKLVAGYIETKDKHSDVDKLNVLNVNAGNDTLQIVCGAPSVGAGQRVVAAKVGAVMPSGMAIRDTELRGVTSSGMIYSVKELSLPNALEEKDIMILSDSYEIGQALSE